MISSNNSEISKSNLEIKKQQKEYKSQEKELHNLQKVNLEKLDSIRTLKEDLRICKNNRIRHARELKIGEN